MLNKETEAENQKWQYFQTTMMMTIRNHSSELIDPSDPSNQIIKVNTTEIF
jgi:hypothetical protein